MLAQRIKYTDDIPEQGISILSKSILKALLYFDIFNHPLTLAEIHNYCSNKSSVQEVFNELEVLVMQGYLSKQGKYYCINEEQINQQIERRVEGEKEAGKLLKTARRFSRFISYFPFVRGICLSGSLSKGYADKDSDIDYFIITETERLWLCRTMLVLFKKIVLFNSHKYFCVNYFVDAGNLQIPDRNIFTAIELASVIPTCNSEIYMELMRENKWMEEHLPNSVLRDTEKVLSVNKSVIKRLLEWFFSGRVGEYCDKLCFRITLSAWKRKFPDFSDEQFDLRLRSSKNVSKHHPNGFQEKVLKRYAENIKKYEAEFEVNLV